VQRTSATIPGSGAMIQMQCTGSMALIHGFQRHVSHKEPPVSRDVTNSRHVRPKHLCLLEPTVTPLCAPRPRPVDVSHEIAGPILNAVAVLKVLRQALGTWREGDAWQQPVRYEVSPDDCLSLTTYSLDELERALEALGEVETLIKAYERGGRT
jgi:hypothetical protein